MWHETKLKNLAEIVYGSSPKGILDNEGDYKVIGTGEEIRRGNKYLVDGETIVLGRKGTIDKPIYSDGKIWIIDTAFYLTEFNNVNVKYLYYLLVPINYANLSESTGLPSLSRNNLYEIKLNLPQDKSEQTAIAIILSTVDNAIEQTEKLIAKYKRIKTGLMKDLLTKGIDENGNIRSEKTHKFKDSPLGRIPVEWEVKTLSKCSRFLDNLRRPIKETDRQLRQGNYPYYGATGVIDYIDNFLFDETLILFGEDGENILSRNLPVALIAKGKFWVNNHAHVIKPNENMNINYLCNFLETLDYAPLNTSTAQPKITKSKLEAVMIKIPDKKEQERIVEIIESVENLIKNEISVNVKNKKLKSGLMQDLLTGKVRVPEELIEEINKNLER